MASGEGDKRSVTTDALETLGTKLTPNERRDAIHLAVENVVAQVKLFPGQDVCCDGGLPGELRKAVGIVDPFLKEPVYPGERFWLVVYPRQIHSLRHVWTHPAFPDVPEVIDEVPRVPGITPVGARMTSELWLRAWCASNDCPSYETVMAVIKGEAPEHHQWNPGEYLHFDGSDAHGAIPAEFWVHVEKVLGHEPAHKPSSLSCSC
jgi:hypothetical protein